MRRLSLHEMHDERTRAFGVLCLYVHPLLNFAQLIFLDCMLRRDCIVIVYIMYLL